MVSWLADYIDMSCHLPYIGYIYRSLVALSITEKGRLELWRWLFLPMFAGEGMIEKCLTTYEDMCHIR